MDSKEYNSTVIGSRMCEKCGQIVRVIPGAECMCEARERMKYVDYNDIKPLNKKEAKLFKDLLKRK